MKSSALLETKLKQSADLFHKDYVAGPTDRFHEDWKCYSVSLFSVFSADGQSFVNVSLKESFTYVQYFNLFKESSCLQDPSQESPLVLPEQVSKQHLQPRVPEKSIKCKVRKFFSTKLLHNCVMYTVQSRKRWHPPSWKTVKFATFIIHLFRNTHNNINFAWKAWIHLFKCCFVGLASLST